MLGLVFGHTVYAITTVLAAFMAGLALGSLLFARLAARIRNLIRAYGWLEIGVSGYGGTPRYWLTACSPALYAANASTNTARGLKADSMRMTESMRSGCTP